MGRPLQQQSLVRKLVYFGLIVVLFTVAILFRSPKYAYSLDNQAQAMELREEDQGEVQLTESALRLSLTGSRGFAICGLWWTAMEKKKRQEWNEWELIVKSITKLQPHFISAWLFLSWDLGYNISVESDQVKDKYYYISRGMDLLSEGARHNRDNPDLRFFMAFMYQHKFGLADEANTLRSLFQMSCIDPLERDRKVLLPDDKTVNLPAFEKFCRNYPYLVRRLHDKLGYESPEKVVEFLLVNEKLPSRYRDEPKGPGRPERSRLKPPAERFPILAPPSEFSPNELTEEKDVLPAMFNNHDAARAWYGYAQDPVPPPERTSSPTTRYDRRRYRLPKSPILILYRHYPARAQEAVAEYLETDGWFDTPWRLDEAFPDLAFTSPTEVGEGLAGEAWGKAHQMYKQYGERNGLYFEPNDLQRLTELAQRYYDANPGVGPETQPETLPPFLPSPAEQAQLNAHKQLFRYESYRKLTQFPHHYYRTQVEALPEAVTAHRLFSEADLLRKRAVAPEKALKLYEDPQAFQAWKKILLDHPEFRYDEFVQEQSYETQKRYLTLARNAMGRERINGLLHLQQYLARGTFCPPAGPERWFMPRKLFTLPAPGARAGQVLLAPIFRGPLDGDDPDGLPIIRPESRVESEKRDVQRAW